MKLILTNILLLLCVHAFTQDPRLVIPSGHSGFIWAVDFSPDEKKILTGADDHIVKIWDTETGHEILELKGHIGKINSATFSPDGKKIATASADSSIIIWNASSGEIITEYDGFDNQVSHVAFNANSTMLVATSMDNTIKTFDVATGQLLNTLRDNDPVFLSASFSRDGKKILSTAAHTGPVIWDATTGKPIVRLEWNFPAGINHAFFSPDEKTIITVSYDHIAGQWDAETGKQIQSFSIPGEQFKVVRLSEDGERLYTVSLDGSIKIWSVSSGKVIQQLNTLKGKLLTTLAISKKEDRIIAGTIEGSAHLISLPDDKLLHSLKSYTNSVGFAHFSDEGSKILVMQDMQTYKVLDALHFRLNATIFIQGNELNSADIIPGGKKVLITAGSDSLFVADASNGKLLYLIEDTPAGQDKPLFSNDGGRFFLLGIDSVARGWETKSGNRLRLVNPTGNPVIKMDCNEDGSRIMTLHQDGTVIISDPISGDTLSVIADQVNKNTFVQLSPDGKKVLAFSDKKVLIWDAVRGKVMPEIIAPENLFYNGALFSPDGKWFLKETTQYNILAYKFGDSKPSFIISGTSEPFIKIAFSSDGKEIITASKRLVQIWNAETGVHKKTIPLDLNFEFADINLRTGKILSYRNSEFKVMEFPEGNEVACFYLIEDKEWAVIHPSGLFDATPRAMELMYWVKGDEVIELNQLKDRFYQPGLWNMIMEGKGLRSVAGMSDVKLFPDVQTGEITEGILPVHLVKRDGGYGKITVYINNIEVIEDARPADFDTAKASQTIHVNVAPFLAEGMDNHITVKAQSNDGLISSRGVRTIKPASDSLKTRKPALYAIFCGTNDYSNSAINLRYPVPDAEAMAKAISLSGGNLFGTDSTHLYILTNPGEIPTTKENIRNTFKEVKNLAKAEDIVLIYLSGHGITLGSDNEDFYYLTKDASGSRASSFRDPVLREKQTISTNEFTQWLNEIAALKRIMIIDACGSGKAVDNMLAKRNIDALQIRAIDRMKDRTGLYIISGCTADAESYESNIYGQGLLTYSILEGMKGPALRDYKMVDILNVLQYARERVPMIASGLGGIQEPQMLFPTNGSFDIGMVNESDKRNIPLNEVKLVFVRPVLQEASKKRDILRLMQEVKLKMIEINATKGPKSEFNFLDVDEFPGACSISGIYTIENDLISLDGYMQFDGRDIPLKLEKINRKDFASILIAEALKKLE